jgi:8-oxo-dGTP diphosphatase
MAPVPGLLARGPWARSEIKVAWREDAYEPDPTAEREADVALAALRDRGSPSYDGLAARLASFHSRAGGLSLELQPARWALRLVPAHAAQSLSILCIVRAADGRWLAGRRAAWLASWASRWALGAGGSVEVGENPVDTMERELEEEWSVAPRRLTAEALVHLPSGVVMLIGMAWLEDGASVVPDPEHEEFAWWPSDVESWPPEGDEPLRRMGAMLAGE